MVIILSLLYMGALGVNKTRNFGLFSAKSLKSSSLFIDRYLPRTGSIFKKTLMSLSNAGVHTLQKKNVMCWVSNMSELDSLSLISSVSFQSYLMFMLLIFVDIKEYNKRSNGLGHYVVHMDQMCGKHLDFMNARTNGMFLRPIRPDSYVQWVCLQTNLSRQISAVISQAFETSETKQTIALLSPFV